MIKPIKSYIMIKPNKNEKKTKPNKNPFLLRPFFCLIKPLKEIVIIYM